MYRIVLSIAGRTEQNDFESRVDAQERMRLLRQMFYDEGFEFYAFDKATFFYLYLLPDENIKGRVGLFAIPETRKEGEPFLRTKKS